MIFDWCNIKDPQERSFMNDNVQFSRKIYTIFNSTYAFSGCTYVIAFFQSYFTESVENRKLVLPTKFPFPSKISPIFEVLCFMQLFMLIVSAIGCAAIDSLFLAMVIILNIG